MAYPGNPELSAEAQERVLTAFGQVVTKLQVGQFDEASIGLDFVLRLDPTFAPAVFVKQQLAEGTTEFDLSGILAQLQATTPEMIDNLLVEAVDDFNQRDFTAAKQKVDQVLRELPGHMEARQLATQINEALKVQQQVNQLVNQAKQALAGGDPQEAANFVMMAQALDPHNQSIQSALEQIQSVVATGQLPPSAGDDDLFAPIDTSQDQAALAGAAEPAAPVDDAFDSAAASPGFGAAAEENPGGGFGFDAQPADQGLGFDAQPAGTDQGFGFDAQPAGTDQGFGFDAQPAGTDQGLGFDAQPAQADQGLGFDAQPAQADQGFGFETQQGPAADAGFSFDPPSAQGADAGFSFDPPSSEGADPGFGFDASQEPAADAGIGFDAQPASDAGFGFDAQPEAGGAGMFEAPDAGAFAAPAAGGDDDGRIQGLINQGEQAFSQGSLDQAIDCWSQIFLIDPNHPEAGRLVEEARLARDDLERVLEGNLSEARTLAEGGSFDKAITLVDEVLQQRPTHIEASEMRESLSEGVVPTTAAPAAPSLATDSLASLESPALPDLAEDLFQEELPGVDELAPLEPGIAESEIPDPKKKKARARGGSLPMQKVVAGLVCVVVLLLGVWFGKKLLSGSSGGAGDSELLELNQAALTRAEQLANQGRLEEAINVLQGHIQQHALSEAEVGRITSKIDQYEGLLHPTPTPIPAALNDVERLLARGLLLDAFVRVEQGLAQTPRDVGLRSLREQILAKEPLVVNLERALSAGNHRTAVSIAQELLEVYPGQEDFVRALERSLFNAALAELKEYNLTGAEVHLAALVNRRPDDEEARRILNFINTYKARPVDMRLRVFIGNLTPR